ncbi:hypothetical protein HYPSUDRAFT_203412 [Hypholoma sublateritium FD-334 SS-4]|uniref:Uncharacterized protein n=1 Tax=Hypholoma sublateritium (strain FD-334 SS-4) TaxID=945553 RepID=A0A0D2L2B4_HYPSF|nr:hypothetical protein HYPSUDRAFT_203412 [Hypholoma sublateritium FD-334 SS-4]
MSNGQQGAGSAIPDDNATVSPGGSHASNNNSPRAAEAQVLGNFTGQLAPDHQRLLDDLAATIDEFRNGHVEKTKAYTQLFNRLTAYDDINVSQGQKITAFAAYSKELESAEANSIRASERGRAYLPAGHPSRPDELQSGLRRKRPASGSPERGREDIHGGNDHPAYQVSRFVEQFGGATQLADDAPMDHATQSADNTSTAGTTRRFPGAEPSVAADEDDDDGEEHGAKRPRRAVEAHMPWYNRKADVDAGPLRPSCEQTV